jgi:hypothetical protein
MKAKFLGVLAVALLPTLALAAGAGGAGGGAETAGTGEGEAEWGPAGPEPAASMAVVRE